MAHHAPELIDFLDQHWCSKMAAHAKRQPMGRTPDELIARLEELRQVFLAELSNSSREIFDAMVLEALCEQDLARPFHGFATEADYNHFGRCPFLTAYEAVAISMGKDPRRVTWAMVQPFVGCSLFANEFADRLDRVERAIAWGELSQYFSPMQFLTWAHEYKMTLPAAFIDRTFVRGEPIQYWHEAYEDTCAELSAVIAELEAQRIANAALQAKIDEHEQRTFDDWIDGQNQIDELRNGHESCLAALETELSEVRLQNTNLQAEAKIAEVSTTERNSLLTIAISAAIDGYRYDPQKDRNAAAEEIAGAANLLGLKISGETVLKYLKMATKLKGFILPNLARPKPKSAKSKPNSV